MCLKRKKRAGTCSDTPVSFSLYKDGVLTNVLDTNLETPSYIFNGDEEQTHNYQLRIEWDGSITDFPVLFCTE